MANQVKLAKTAAVPELSSFQYRAVLRDADNALIAEAALANVYMTLKDVTTGDVINGRDEVDVLGDELTLPTTGNVILQFADADMPAIGTSQYQQRRLTLDFRFVSGGRYTHEVLFYVQNLTDVED